MAKQILTGLDLLALPSLTTPKAGSIGFGAKSDGLYQKIGTVESKLSTQSDIDTAIDDLEIGGRNLITDSTNINILPLYGVYGTYTSIANSSVPSGAVFTATNLNRSLGTYAFFLPLTNSRARFKVTNGERVTVSFYIKTNVTQILKGPSFNLYTEVNSTWKKVQHNFIYPASGNLHYTLTGADLTSFEVHSVKMERGNKATDWTPAPEDQVSDWSTTDIASFSYIKNKPTQLSQFTDNIGVASHIANKANPHNVTASQVGALALTGGIMSNTNLVTNLNADLLDGYHASETAATGLLYTYREPNIGETQSWYKLGTLYTPAVTGNNSSKVVAQITGLASFGSNEHRILILKASTRGSISVTGLMLKGDSTNVRVGYVNNGSNIEIWVGYTGTYNTATNIQVLNSNNFTVNRDRVNSMPTGFVAGSISITATTDSNVASATKLQTARTIAGVSFDGTANIAIPFANLANKPTTLSGYEITDAVTTNTTQTITGAKTFSALLTASAGVNTPKVDFGNGFTIEPSGTELVFKYNNVIKQRMLSDGTILAVGGITALSTE